MKDIAFHVTDIAENCIRAGADRIGISIMLEEHCLELVVTDNGCGMDADTVRKVTSPFYTTRTTRKVGLGLPFLFQNAEQSGGHAEVISEVGKGTRIKAVFMTDNIDCPPVGDLGETLMQVIVGNPSVDVSLRFRCGERNFTISTSDITSVLDGISISVPEVAVMIREILSSNIGEVFAGGLNY